MLSLEDAIRIAATAHDGQVDKGGAPYILHPLRVMMACPPGPAQIVGVLHDVMEDAKGWQVGTGWHWVLQLQNAEPPEGVLEALQALTRQRGEAYSSYIKRVKANPLAVVVKLADLADNMRIERIPHPQPADFARLAKYREAVEALAA
jgi:(p)ppGpp synthase/HD superfamily hydrolase